MIKSKLGSVKKMRHIQPISCYPSHERIKTFLIKNIYWNDRVPRLVELSHGCCIKQAFPCHCKSAKFFHVSQPELLLGSVKKKRYLRPWRELPEAATSSAVFATDSSLALIVPYYPSHQGAWPELPVLNMICMLPKFYHTSIVKPSIWLLWCIHASWLMFAFSCSMINCV